MSGASIKPRIVTFGPLRAAMAFGSGLAALGSFAPDTSLQAVELEASPQLSGVEALAGDFSRLSGDMHEAAERLGERPNQKG